MCLTRIYLSKEFWNIVNNVNKVSVNILSGSDVSWRAWMKKAS